MRSAAEIEPVALIVNFDGLVAGNGIDQFDLEGFALVAEHLLGLLAVPHILREGFVLCDDLAHLLLDGDEVFRRERLVAEEIVIESAVDNGTDRYLRSRPQRLHRFGQHMRGVVPDQFQRAGIVATDKFDACVLHNGIREVHDLSVQRHRDRALGERRRDALGDVEACGAFWKFAARAIGKSDGDRRWFDGLEIRQRVRKSRRGRIFIRHICLLWLTPANGRR